ncbi:repetitive organellar protein-like isoform X2 [Palaemon carinicauda]|uniref:repetitive organellar protein-like isoform X2 n=1 Tax=Palaemon carinicauda TaxID=392227 RepID=UPI0035B66B65
MEALGLTCPTCATLLKKLNNAQEWKKFYHQKLQNKEKFLHIVVDYEREKQRNVELQLAYDQRTRDSAYVREQMTSLLLEVEPLKEKLRKAELEAKENLLEREQMEDKITGLQFSNEQLQHQLQDLRMKADHRLVETLERKILTTRSEIRRLKLTIENKTCEIDELRNYQADRRLHFERINKRSFWALKLAKTLAELIGEDHVLEKGFMGDMKRLDFLLNAVGKICQSHYLEFCKREEKKLKRENHHLTSLIPSMGEWLDDFDKGKADELEPFKRECNQASSREGKKLEEMLLDSDDENMIQIKEERSSCASVPPYSFEKEADQQERPHTIKKEQVCPEGVSSPALSSSLFKGSTIKKSDSHTFPSIFRDEAVNSNKVRASKLFDLDDEDPFLSVVKEKSSNNRSVNEVAPSKKLNEKKQYEAINGNRVSTSKLFDSDDEDPVPSVHKERISNNKSVNMVAPSKSLNEKKPHEAINSNKVSSSKLFDSDVEDLVSSLGKEKSSNNRSVNMVGPSKTLNEKKHLVAINRNSVIASKLSDSDGEDQDPSVRKERSTYNGSVSMVATSKKLNEKERRKSCAESSPQKDLAQEMKEFVLRKSLSGCTPVKNRKRTKRTSCESKPISTIEETGVDDIISAILKDMRPHEKLECLDNSFSLPEPETCKRDIEDEVGQSVFIDLANAEPLVEDDSSSTRVSSEIREGRNLWERPRILLSQSSEGFPVNIENETSCLASETGNLPQKTIAANNLPKDSHPRDVTKKFAKEYNSSQGFSQDNENGSDLVDCLKERDNERKLIGAKENSIDCHNSNNMAISGNPQAVTPLEKKKKTPKLGNLKEQGLVYMETYGTDGTSKVNETNSSHVNDEIGNNSKESIDEHKNIKYFNDKEISFRDNMESNGYEHEKMEDIFGIISDSDDDVEQEESLRIKAKKAQVVERESIDKINMGSEEKESNDVDKFVTSGREGGTKNFEGCVEKSLSETICHDSIYIDEDPLGNKNLPKVFMTSKPTFCMKVCENKLKCMTKPDSSTNTKGSKEDVSKMLSQSCHQENGSAEVPSDSHCLQKEEISIDSSHQFLIKEKGAGSKDTESRSYRQKRKSCQRSTMMNEKSNKEKERVSLKIEELKKQYKKIMQSSRKSLFEGTLMGNGDEKSKADVKVPPKNLAQDCEKMAVEEDTHISDQENLKQGTAPSSDVKEISLKEVDEIFGYISDSDEEMTSQIQSKMGSDNEVLRTEDKMNNHQVVEENSAVESRGIRKCKEFPQIIKGPVIDNGEINKLAVSPRESQIVNKSQTLIKGMGKQSDISSCKRQCISSLSEDDGKSEQPEMDAPSTRTRSRSANRKNELDTEVDPHNSSKLLNRGQTSESNVETRVRTRSSSRIASRLGIKDFIAGKEEEDSIAHANVGSSAEMGKVKVTAKIENNEVQPACSSANAVDNSGDSCRRRSRSGRILALEQKKKAFQSEMEERFARGKENAKFSKVDVVPPPNEGEKIEERIPQGIKVTAEEVDVPFVESNSVEDCNSKDNELNNQAFSELSLEQPVKNKSEKSIWKGKSLVTKESRSMVLITADHQESNSKISSVSISCDVDQNFGSPSQELESGLNSCIHELDSSAKQALGDDHSDSFEGFSNVIDKKSNDESNVISDDTSDSVGTGKVDDNLKNCKDIKDVSVKNMNSILFGTESSGPDEEISENERQNSNGYKKRKIEQRKPKFTKRLRKRLVECSIERDNNDEDGKHGRVSDSNNKKSDSESLTKVISSEKKSKVLHKSSRMVLTSESYHESESDCERLCNRRPVKRRRRIIVYSDSDDEKEKELLNSSISKQEQQFDDREHYKKEQLNDREHDKKEQLNDREHDKKEQLNDREHDKKEQLNNREHDKKEQQLNDREHDKKEQLNDREHDKKEQQLNDREHDKNEQQLNDRDHDKKEQRLNDREHEFVSSDSDDDNCINRDKSSNKPTKKERSKTRASKKFKSKFALRALRMHKKSYYPKPCQPQYQHIKNEDKTASENNLNGSSPSIEDRSSQEPLKKHSGENLDPITPSKSSNGKEICQVESVVKDPSEIARRLSMNMKSQNKDKRTAILLDTAPRLSQKNQRTFPSKQESGKKNYVLPDMSVCSLSKKDFESPGCRDFHNSRNYSLDKEKSQSLENSENSSSEEGTMEICEEANIEVSEKQKVSPEAVNNNNAKSQMSHPGLVRSLAQLGSLSQPKAAPKAPKIIRKNVPASSDFVDKLFSKPEEKLGNKSKESERPSGFSTNSFTNSGFSCERPTGFSSNSFTNSNFSISKPEQKLGNELRECERPSGFSTNSFTNSILSNPGKVTESDVRLGTNTLKSLKADSEIINENNLNMVRFQDRPSIGASAVNSPSFKFDSSKSDDILLNFYGSQKRNTADSLTKMKSEGSLPSANFSSESFLPDELGMVSLKVESKMEISQQCPDTRPVELPGDVFKDEKFMKPSEIRKGEQREDIDSSLSDILDLLIHNRLSSQLWQQGINELCGPKVFENDLNAVASRAV